MQIRSFGTICERLQKKFTLQIFKLIVFFKKLHKYVHGKLKGNARKDTNEFKYILSILNARRLPKSLVHRFFENLVNQKTTKDYNTQDFTKNLSSGMSITYL